MSLLFDKDFFKYLEKSISFGKHFENKAKYALTKLAQPGNYFLSYILLGKYYDEQNLPDYLQERNFETIKNRIYKVEVITVNCNLYFNSLRASSISKFNFTNIFEWMSPQDYEDLLWDTIRVSRDHSIITYRNLLVEREHPSSLDKKLNSNKKLAQHLLEKDRSFIYNNYVVEVVEKESGIWNIEPNRLPAETSSKTF
jgi:S-adenosylmethionine-diacylglycerol 3-amino-3-carboxypropyl transferase